jgi:hypothetical protein
MIQQSLVHHFIVRVTIAICINILLFPSFITEVVLSEVADYYYYYSFC